MKAVVAAFNQEKALVGAFSVIVQLVVEPMDRFAALLSTEHLTWWKNIIMNILNTTAGAFWLYDSAYSSSPFAGKS